MSIVTDDMVQAALDAYSENEWRTSASAMRAAIAAVAPLIAQAERRRVRSSRTNKKRIITNRFRLANGSLTSPPPALQCNA